MLRILLCLMAFALPARAEQVTVFAAASLKGALDLVAQGWQAQSGHQLVVSYGGSAALAKQIEAGAPAEVYLSAAPEWMDAVAGSIVAGSRVDFLSNTLVLVGPAGAKPFDLQDLPAQISGGKLAMGLLTSVPAGQYGKAALTSLGLWPAVAGSVAETDTVRAALALVARGEAVFGVVYGSDAQAEPGVAVVAQFPATSHPTIVYTAAMIAPETEGAADFLAYLQGDAAISVFLSQGFLPLMSK